VKAKPSGHMNLLTGKFVQGQGSVTIQSTFDVDLRRGQLKQPDSEIIVEFTETMPIGIGSVVGVGGRLYQTLECLTKFRKWRVKEIGTYQCSTDA
jgi:hypothetical protein